MRLEPERLGLFGLLGLPLEARGQPVAADALRQLSSVERFAVLPLFVLLGALILMAGVGRLRRAGLPAGTLPKPGLPTESEGKALNWGLAYCVMGAGLIVIALVMIVLGRGLLPGRGPFY